MASRNLSPYASRDELNTFAGMARTILIPDLGGFTAGQLPVLRDLLLPGQF